MEAYHQRVPAQIELAGGLEGGIYDELSGKLGERLTTLTGSRVKVVASGGSVDNHHRLVSGEVDLAPMQAVAMTDEDLCVVAPLFYEAVHVFVSSKSDILLPEHIAGHKVAVGLTGSGSRLAAEMVLDSLGIAADTTPRIAISWPELSEKQASPSESLPDVAVVCIGKGSRLAASMLDSGRWRLIGLPAAIEISLQHPSLRPMTIRDVDYPNCDLPPEGIETVGMTAFLAAKSATPDKLVTAALHALYQEPAIAAGLIPKQQVQEWQGLDFHRAARKFFEESE